MRRASSVLIIILLAAAAMLLPQAAHDSAAQDFATNTPPPPTSTPRSLIIATNTPPPTVATPAAPPARFALRAWREADLTDALENAVRALRPGDHDGQQAVALLQHELERRFPGAPHNPARRAQLVAALMAAPPGSVDARAIVRPHLQNLLAQQADSALAVMEANGFMIEVLRANLDGTEPPDAVIHTRYPADTLAPVRYQDYLLALADSQGRLRLLDTSPTAPAAPVGSLTSVLLLGIGDYNGDRLDDVAITAAVAGDINRRLYIYGQRSGQAVSLVEPGREIVYGALEGPTGVGTISVFEQRVESAFWDCLGQRAIVWSWQQNFWRPQPDARGFVLQPTSACRFYEEGPYYDLLPSEAIMRLDEMIAQIPGQNTAITARAQVIKAMLYALEGQPEIAASQMRAARDLDAGVTPYATAFFAAAAEPGARPIHLCAALAQVDSAACDVDLVLARLFDDAPLRRDRPVIEQLAERGITVQESFALAQVGRVSREVAGFDLAGMRWWAFAPLDPQVYTAERIDTPPAYAPTATPPPAVIAPTQAVYDALLTGNDPARALSLLDNRVRANPGAALSLETRYLQAYIYDLLGDRTRARDSYYELWGSAPRSVWGQLAAVHLEQR